MKDFILFQKNLKVIIRLENKVKCILNFIIHHILYDKYMQNHTNSFSFHNLILIQSQFFAAATIENRDRLNENRRFYYFYLKFHKRSKKKGERNLKLIKSSKKDGDGDQDQR